MKADGTGCGVGSSNGRVTWSVLACDRVLCRRFSAETQEERTLRIRLGYGAIITTMSTGFALGPASPASEARNVGSAAS